MIQILGQLIFLFMITLPLSVTFFYAVFAGKMGYKIKPEFIEPDENLSPAVVRPSKNKFANADELEDELASIEKKLEGLA